MTFGRNPREVEDNYPDRETALGALKGFLKDHGYNLREGVEGNREEDSLLDYYKIEEFLVHESDLREPTRDEKLA